MEVRYLGLSHRCFLFHTWLDSVFSLS
jgi:hypothetical protein